MEENNKRIVIVGGGYAGMMAVSRLAKQVKNHELVLIQDSPFFKERIRNHEIAANSFKNELPIQKLLPTGVLWKKGMVQSIKPDENLLEMEGQMGHETIPYSYLIYATGSAVNVSNESAHIHSIDSEPNALRLQQALLKNPQAKVAIVGAGLSGIELASELAEKYSNMQLHLFDSKEIGSQFSDQGKKYIRSTLQKLGVILHDTSKIKIHDSFLQLEDETKFQADIIVATVGFACTSPRISSAFQLKSKGQIIVNSTLRTKSHPNIFCVGDSAWIEGDFYQSQRMGCAFAMPMGAHAADTLARILDGKVPRPFGFQFAAQCVSLGRSYGLIQFVSGDDKPLPKVITGKTGALVKELVNQYTVWMLRVEAFFRFRLYTWPGKNKMISKSSQTILSEKLVS